MWSHDTTSQVDSCCYGGFYTSCVSHLPDTPGILDKLETLPLLDILCWCDRAPSISDRVPNATECLATDCIMLLSTQLTKCPGPWVPNGNWVLSHKKSTQGWLHALNGLGHWGPGYSVSFALGRLDSQVMGTQSPKFESLPFSRILEHFGMYSKVIPSILKGSSNGLVLISSNSKEEAYAALIDDPESTEFSSHIIHAYKCSKNIISKNT